MKFSATAVLASLLILSASLLHAADLKGNELVEAMNGKAYSCFVSGNAITVTFKKVKAGSSEFPYTYTRGSQTLNGAYVIAKNGKLRHKGSNKGRALAYNNKGQLLMKRSGASTARCVLN